jgi:signal transduction histidine kinase
MPVMMTVTDAVPSWRPIRRRWMDAQLWRGLSLLRLLALAWIVLQYAVISSDYAHPERGWVVLALMALWTGVMVLVQREPRGRTLPWLVIDLVVGVAAIVAASSADTAAVVAERSLPVLWATVPVLAFAVVRGIGVGLLAAVPVIAACAGVRGALSGTVVSNAVLVVVSVVVLGWVTSLARDAEVQRAESAALRARDDERRRLGRVVHDGVLQVLTQVAHRGPELGPEGRRLAAEAAEQEAALRALLAADAQPLGSAGAEDLGAAVSRLASTTVTVSPPAEPVMLEAARCHDVVAAVRAALDNVSRHAPGARAWVLVEDEEERVRVTVRDDGPGFDPARLDAARAEGRLGVRDSIEGRIADLGGTATVTSRPGAGVVVELVVPRAG